MLWNDKEWREIPGFSKYYASRDGEILSTKKKSPIVMKQAQSKDGYKYVLVYNNGKSNIKLWVHRAVLMAWDRLPKENEEGRHLNDNHNENFIENLAWGTRQDNVNDKRRNNRIPCGEKAGGSKLTEQQVREIRKLKGTMSYREMAKLFGVTHTTIRKAAIGLRWKHMEVQNAKN